MKHIFTDTFPVSESIAAGQYQNSFLYNFSHECYIKYYMLWIYTTKVSTVYVRLKDTDMS